MSRWIAPSTVALLLATGCATSTASGPIPGPLGPDGKSGYIAVHGEMMRDFGGIDGPFGGAVEWGSFQNKLIGAGTKIGYSSVGTRTGMPRELFFGGGPQFHIQIGRHFLLLPAFNMGYRLADSPAGIDGGLAIYGSLGAAYRYKSLYFGLEAEKPIFLPLPNESSAFFPNLTTAGFFFGYYY